MSRDFEDIYKKIDQSHRELHKQDDNISKDQAKILKEINDVKREVKNIAFKVDTMLQILNNFTIMLMEDEENLDDNYENDNESWVPPEQEEDWNSYDEEDEEED